MTPRPTDSKKPAPPLTVRFWGTRGSIAKPGPGTVRYGGNTSCIEVRTSGGTLIVVDCGTGAHALGHALLASATAPLSGHMLITHTHWDHLQGIPFFAPFFREDGQWNVYAPRGLGQRVREVLAGQMQYPYFPVSLDRFAAKIEYHELVEGRFTIGDATVTTHYLNHPALTLGYRIEVDGVSFVYASDHEPHSRRPLDSRPPSAESVVVVDHPGDRRHLRFIAGADLLVHDAQYTAAEYAFHHGWGHSPVEYVVDLALAAGVKELALYHHDPHHDDPALDEVVENARRRAAAGGSSLKPRAAAEGDVLELKAPARPRKRSPEKAPSPARVEAIDGKRVLIGMDDAETAVLLAEAAGEEGIRVTTAADGDTVLERARTEHPDLVLLDLRLAGRDGLDVCRALRAGVDDPSRAVPIVIVSSEESPVEVAAGAEAGVTDWLVKPFSKQYARTRMSAWILRTHAHWVRAPLPPDEETRLRALRDLGLLDTPPEEAFDRLTRLAARVFDAPIALVSLVDSERQWFKSCQGLEVRETPREAAFCAHAILNEEPLVVPDALQDLRFADNPLVSGEPRVRFYAGQPLHAPDGSRIGTLCIIDHRPRRASDLDLGLLKDLASLVEKELASSAPS